MERICKMNILCVDDDNLLRELYLATFEYSKHKPIIAENGKDGLEKLVQLPSSGLFVFTDRDMPVMDGFEFAKAVRQDPKYAAYKDVPIIGVTGEPRDDWKSIITEQLSKPFGPQQLLTIIEKYSK